MGSSHDTRSIGTVRVTYAISGNKASDAEFGIR